MDLNPNELGIAALSFFLHDKNIQMRKRLLVMALIGLGGCDLSHKDSESELPPLETPPSYLGFRVSFPQPELQAGVNRVLPQTLFDDAVALKGEKDTLYLKIVREGDLELDIQEGRLLASIPLEITASVKKKVLGITFSNESAPLTFNGTMKASAQISITDRWDLDAICRFESFDLGDDPKITLMGMSFNVGKTVSKALEDHRDQISDLLCRALNGAIDFRQTIDAVWKNLQQPQQIAGKPQSLWLCSEPIALNGIMQPLQNDELAIHLEYRTRLRISTEKQPVVTPVPLGKQSEPLNDQPSLVAYPDIQLPFRMLTQLLRAKVVGMDFSYDDYRIEVTDAKIGRSGQKVKVTLFTQGDLNGDVTVLGRPVLSPSKELTLEDFSYEIHSENELVNLTDWAVHLFAEPYLADQLHLDVKPVLDNLDDIIAEGIASSPVGSKMALEISLNAIDSYKTRLTDDYIEWIFYVEGRSELTLKRGLFREP